MKVAMLTADYPPDVWSGIGVAVHRQATDLAALGASVDIVKVAPGDGVPEIGDIVWIHLHSLPLAGLAIDLRRRLGVKLAYTVHTQPWLELAGQGRFWLDTQTRLFGECDRVIFLSNAELAAAQTLFPSLPEAHVIPNGVPAPPAVINEERDGVMFAGRFAVSKGVLLLEQIIRRLPGIRFTIAGGHGDAEGEAAMRRLSIGWLSREELNDRLSRSALVLIPSRYEPFGLVALEAMRVGTPVLAANVGGLRDTVREGSGGVLIDSDDPGVWAGEVLRILRDADLWSTLHNQGPRFVNRHYRSDKIAERLLHEIYQPLVRCGVAAVMPT